MIYRRNWFVKELAKRSGFYQKDIMDLLKGIEDILSDVASTGDTLYLRGIFEAKTIEIRERKGYDAVRGKPTVFPKTNKFVIIPAENLRTIAKQASKRKESES